MICPFCSLLCEVDLAKCERREASLIQIQKRRDALRSTDATSFTKNVDWAKQQLAQADQILIAGRIASVESARAAIELARAWNATIDCAELGHQFRNILALQRNGGFSVSLGEARDLADLFWVVGDDSLLDAYPRLPEALTKATAPLASPDRSRCVLLLGQFTDRSVRAWSQAGFDVWSVPCEIESIPRALRQWTRWGRDNLQESDAENAESLFQRLDSAHYSAVVWAASTLPLDQADLWIEQLMDWIASQNETVRMAALPLSGHDGTFAQVCTWLTGFPGRIRFQDGIPNYDPFTCDYRQWLAQAASDESIRTAIVLIDETMNSVSATESFVESAHHKRDIIEITMGSTKFPALAAGAEFDADLFRADQTLLARVTGAAKQPEFALPAFDWLRKLMP